MTKVKLIGTIMLGLAVVAAEATAGQRVGNGDALRLIFASAKDHASHLVLKMREQAMLPNMRDDVKDWLLQNKDALAGDIVASPHEWSLDPAATCAETVIGTPAAPISLSYPTCANRIYSLDDAGQLLVHESVHHFGITDEAFADAVAIAVYGAWHRGELEWTQMTPNTSRYRQASVWTGSEVLTVGGMDASGRPIASPQRYNPATDAWSALSAQGAPARYGLQAVWTGTTLLVWGGYINRGSTPYWQNSGAIWDPATDQWTALVTPYGASELDITALGNIERAVQTLVWTGKEAIIFGGIATSHLPGGIYDVAARSWREIPGAGAPDRSGGHTAVWTGDKMIVWGGINSGRNKTDTGAFLSLAGATPRWTEMRTDNAPAKRDGHTAVWTGAEMIVFGGDVSSVETQGTGGVYDAASGTWTANFSAESVPARTGHTAVWTGHELLVYGGKPKQSSRRLMFAAVSAYDPVNQNWRVIDSKNAPKGRSFHSSVWTGSSMVVIGGMDSVSTLLDNGGLFYP